MQIDILYEIFKFEIYLNIYNTDILSFVQSKSTSNLLNSTSIVLSFLSSICTETKVSGVFFIAKPYLFFIGITNFKYFTSIEPTHSAGQKLNR